MCCWNFFPQINPSLLVQLFASNHAFKYAIIQDVANQADFDVAPVQNIVHALVQIHNKGVNWGVVGG